MSEMAEAVKRGERLATARAISLVEDDAPAATALLEELHADSTGAWRIGITGPPGAGKSTLTGALVGAWRNPPDDAAEAGGDGDARAEPPRVAVVAVDPTSPFTGGALLGDRVRMSKLATDPGVFIRSMASRGSLGGLARRTEEVVGVLAAGGFDPVLIETVGVGQTEVAIAGLADTTVVVLSPESGDGVQAMKAGLMEIADIYVINKADRDGAARLQRDVEMTLDLAGHVAWRPPVVKTVATAKKGIDELQAELARHRESLASSGGLEERRRRRVAAKIRSLVEEKVLAELWETGGRSERLDALVARVAAGEISPYAAVRSLLDDEDAPGVATTGGSHA